MYWQCGKHRLNLDGRPLVMGILNVTPDSFSDGGCFLETESALAWAKEMIDGGADILDVGGESTRPGAVPVDADEECRRVLPVIEALSGYADLILSVDTAKASVAREAVRLGACIINDVTAMRGDPEMSAVVRDSGAGVVLMHMRGTPRTMQQDPHYEDVAEEVAAWLQNRLQAAEASGIAFESMVVDPGIGFGKTLEHNVLLLNRLDWLGALGRPVMVGVSRKRFIGALGGEPNPDGRLPGSVAAAVCAAWQGAHILRVHDVAASVQALRVAAAIRTPSMVSALMEESG